MQQGEDGIINTVDDTCTLTLHVLTSVGFGIRYDFKDTNQKLEAPHRMIYRDALLVVIRNSLFVVLFPRWLLALPFNPRHWNQVAEGCSGFELYMQSLVARGQVATAERSDAAMNLLSNLVRANEAATATGGTKGSVGQVGLTDDELYGNLFAATIAGHETTANSIATSIAFSRPHRSGKTGSTGRLSTS